MKLEGKGILMKIFQDLIRLTPAPTIGRESAVFFLTMAVLVICVYLAIDSANRTLVLILVGSWLCMRLADSFTDCLIPMATLVIGECAWNGVCDGSIEYPTVDLFQP